ncbi:MAG: SH3 domain-containing protein [Chloroflexi bacterium]|nr:SH3 domain-containing protein [Chloroflexota bacterium]
MASKAIAAVVAFAVLLSIASAQGYSIRANRGLNVRAAPSRNAAIADTVTSGSILQVVGASGSWLKIDRYGREVWLADWVNFSRLDSSEPKGSQPPTAPIDNCCFVDRQCQSEAEWEAGYWAYQNGQCAAPAQPVASEPAAVDNCCFVDRQCQSDADWLSGYWAFQNSQCPAPTRSSAITPSRPQIEGSARFVHVIERSLNLLRDKAPEWYNYVISAIDTIVEIPNSRDDGLCFAFAHVAARRVAIETCRLSYAGFSNPIVMAGTLSHEACHIHTYEAGTVFPYGQAQEELACGLPGVAIYKLLDPNGLGARVSDLEAVVRLSNEMCRLQGDRICLEAKIAHLYYD